MDISTTTAPDSTQVNAEDFIGASRTVTITGARQGTAEQPVNIDLAEFPGRSYRPGKSMRRVLLAAWGSDTDVYIGRRLTLYCDPDISFGRERVGGIRISAMSNIKEPIKLALTVSRGKRATTVVQPLPDAPASSQRPSNAITADQLKALAEAMTANGFTDKDSWLAYLSQTVGQDVAATKELDKDQAAIVLHELTNAPEPTLPGGDS